MRNMKSNQQSFFERIEKKIATTEGFPFQTIKRDYGISVVIENNVRINCYETETSLHFHDNRIENYIILKGNVRLYRGTFFENDFEKTVANLDFTDLSPGDKAIIYPKTVHVPINRSLSNDPYILLEIIYGIYDESDVTRVYDMHGRDQELNQKWIDLGYNPRLSVKDLVSKIKEQNKK